MKRQHRRQPVVAAEMFNPSLPALHGSARRQWQWAIVLLLVAVTLAAYLPAWFGQPIWDDDAHITRPDLRSLTGLSRIWIEPGATQQYYPLAFSAFWLQYKLWGDSTLGYHMVNILLHCLCALLFLRILRFLQVPGAWFAAAIFALHPVHVESVAWMTELKNTLSGVCYLGGFLAYLRFDQSRRKRAYALAITLFALGLLTKTAIATLPATVLVILWWKRGTVRWQRDVIPLLPFLLLGVGAGALTAWLEHSLFGAKGHEFHLSPIERCLVAGRSIWFHLATLLWPAKLAFMYTRWPIDRTVFWQYVYPGAALVLLIACWILRRKTRAPLAALLFFVGTLFPALGFFNAYSFRYSFVNDHHQYLASLGVIALGSAAAAVALSRTGVWAQAPGKWIWLVLLVALGSMTARRAACFRDDETLWSDTLAKYPDCWMAHHNWGVDLVARGEFAAATEHYRAALRLKPDAEAHFGLATALDAEGKLDEALNQYLAALDLNPDYAEAHSNLSRLYVKKADVSKAVQHAGDAVRLRPNYAEAHYNLGNALNLQGKLAEAATEYAIAAQLKPDYAEAHYNLGGIRLRLGNPKEALAEFVWAVRLQPDNAATRSKLAFVLAQQGRTLEAINEYVVALRLQPDLVEALRNLAYIHATHQNARYRNAAEALRLSEQAVRLTQGQDAMALDALAAALAESGNFSQAVATADRASEVAAAQGRQTLQQQIQARRACYISGKPCRE